MEPRAGEGCLSQEEETSGKSVAGGERRGRSRWDQSGTKHHVIRSFMGPCRTLAFPLSKMGHHWRVLGRGTC